MSKCPLMIASVSTLMLSAPFTLLTSAPAADERLARHRDGLRARQTCSAVMPPIAVTSLRPPSPVIPRVPLPSVCFL